MKLTRLFKKSVSSLVFRRARAAATSFLTPFLKGGAAAVQVWSLTQFYYVDFSKSRIGVNKCVFNKCTIKVCVSCC